MAWSFFLPSIHRSAWKVNSPKFATSKHGALNKGGGLPAASSPWASSRLRKCYEVGLAHLTLRW